MRNLIAGLLAGAAALGAVPAAAEGPVVVELFTSQGCSSCPPADALLKELAGRKDVVALSFHVDYWDRLGWKDPFSSPAATARQRAYARALSLNTVYTPQAVVDGRIDAIGSDRRALARAIENAQKVRHVEASLVREGGEVVVRVAGLEAPQRANVSLVTFVREAVTRVVAGENGGRTLKNANIVRSVERLGPAGETPGSWRVPAREGLDFAVLVQADDGHILGAAILPPG
ncbi:MAG: DUF1223 domain-containing protein [Alphaproteobacteria bacterium]|nr:DUF1223 domain-containing protein [Alphaproteobacteria bacterium]